MKQHIIKIYCSAQELRAFEAPHEVIQNYAGFQVAAVKPAALRKVQRRFPIEDITDQYALPVGGMKINTEQPRYNAKGRLVPHAGYRGARPLPRGPHHY